MFPIVVVQGGASTGLTSRLHCLVRLTHLGTLLRKSLDLVAISGVWKFLIVCFAAICLRRYPGSCVMSEYGLIASVSGGMPNLGSLAGNGPTVMGTGLSVDWSRFGSSGVWKMVVRV